MEFKWLLRGGWTGPAQAPAQGVYPKINWETYYMGKSKYISLNIYKLIMKSWARAGPMISLLVSIFRKALARPDSWRCVPSSTRRDSRGEESEEGG